MKARILGIVFAAVSMATTIVNAGAPASWHSRGIGGGGGMYSPVISPHDPAVMFLGVDMSHMMRTINGGANWETIDFTQLQVRQISEVQFTSTPGVLYCADVHRLFDETNAPRPVKSTDQGITWTQFSQWPPAPNQPARTVFANPHRDDTLIVCTGTRLYFYQNAGTSGAFSVAWTFNTPQGRIGGAFWRGSEVWVGTNEGMLYSSNGGMSFSAAVSPEVSRIASFAGGFDSVTGTLRFYAVTTLYNLSASDFPNSYQNANSNRVWRLDWDPQSSNAWVQVSANIPDTDHVAVVGMARNNPDVVYAAAFRAAANAYPQLCAVWRLSPEDSEWQSIFTIIGNGNILTGWGGINNRATFGGRQFETKLTYNAPCGFTVDPNDANRIILCDNALIHLSKNAATAAPVWEQMYCVADNPGHEPGEFFPPGQSYASNGLEATVWMDLVWTSPTHLVAAALDISPPMSTDGGRRWGFPYESATLGIGDSNAIVFDPVTNRLFVTCSNTISPYEYLGSDDGHTDMPVAQGKKPPGVYFQAPGGANWQPLKTDFGVAAGQPGANPVWLTLDQDHRRLFVSIVSSDADKDGIYVMDLNTGTWSKLPAPTRTDTTGSAVTVQHPFVVRVLADGGIVATYAAHQIGNAALINVGTNGYYKPTSGVFHLAPGATGWRDCSDPRMRYFTRDVVIDPQDPHEMTWFATVWNTDLTGVFPADPSAMPRTYGGLYRTTDGGATWTRIWSGDTSFSGSVTSATLNPDPALSGEMFLATRFSGVWITKDARAPAPAFSRVTNYPFRAPQRVIFNPYDHDEIWIVSNGDAAVVGVRPTTFGEWQLRKFGEQFTVPELAGADADPDGDRFVNLQEYGLRTSPLIANDSAAKYALAGFLTMTFPRYLPALDLTYVIEGSFDLSRWQPLAQTSGQGAWSIFEGALIQSDEGLVSFTDAPMSDATAARFLRLRMSLP
jgi:hypothetical protein